MRMNNGSLFRKNKSKTVETAIRMKSWAEKLNKKKVKKGKKGQISKFKIP